MSHWLLSRGQIRNALPRLVSSPVGTAFFSIWPHRTSILRVHQCQMSLLPERSLRCPLPGPFSGCFRNPGKCKVERGKVPPSFSIIVQFHQLQFFLRFNSLNNAAKTFFVFPELQSCISRHLLMCKVKINEYSVLTARTRFFTFKFASTH